VKKAIKATALYTKAVPTVAKLTQYFNFLNKEPTKIEMLKNMDKLEDLESTLEELLNEVKRTKDSLNRIYLEDSIE